MKIRAFITHKKAEEFKDCQDRFGVNVDTKSIAVSDGMSSSWLQKIWAQLLVDAFVQEREWMPTPDNIKMLCGKWQQEACDFVEQLKRDDEISANIVYRNERALAEQRSAGATLVGIRFNDAEQWSGTVLGDSCLITWDGEHAKFYTSQEGEAFDNFPDYFDSHADRQGKGEPKSISGGLEPKCFLLLVSDPFSDFLYRKNKEGQIKAYMDALLSPEHHADFERLVAAWREEGMHNDDTTLIIAEHDGKKEFDITYADDLDVLRKGKWQDPQQPEVRKVSALNELCRRIVALILRLFRPSKKQRNKRNQKKLGSLVRDILDDYEIRHKSK